MDWTHYIAGVLFFVGVIRWGLKKDASVLRSYLADEETKTAREFLDDFDNTRSTHATGAAGLRCIERQRQADARRAAMAADAAWRREYLAKASALRAEAFALASRTRSESRSRAAAQQRKIRADRADLIRTRRAEAHSGYRDHALKGSPFDV